MYGIELETGIKRRGTHLPYATRRTVIPHITLLQLPMTTNYYSSQKAIRQQLMQADWLDPTLIL